MQVITNATFKSLSFKIKLISKISLLRFFSRYLNFKNKKIKQKR